MVTTLLGSISSDSVLCPGEPNPVPSPAWAWVCTPENGQATPVLPAPESSCEAEVFTKVAGKLRKIFPVLWEAHASQALGDEQPRFHIPNPKYPTCSKTPQQGSCDLHLLVSSSPLSVVDLKVHL